MSDKLYVVTTAYGKQLGMLIEAGKPTELRAYDEESRLNNIYMARVSNVVANINAAFVDIQKGVSCYMSLEEYKGRGSLRVGDMLPVQLIKESVKTKQPTVSASLSIPGKNAVLTLSCPIGVSAKITDKEKREELKRVFIHAIEYAKSSIENIDEDIAVTLQDIGGIIRTRAEEASEEEITEEIVLLYLKLYEILKKAKYATLYSKLYEADNQMLEDAQYFYEQEDVRIVTDNEMISQHLADNSVLYTDNNCPLRALYNVEGVVDKALSKNVYLKSGAYLVIEPTEAMTVIDVNSGKAIKGHSALESRHKINIEAAHEIARQLKLRNISGIIIVDFINVQNHEFNNKLLKELEEAVKGDYTVTNVVDMTGLGLVEITRKKIRRPLIEVFADRR